MVVVREMVDLRADVARAEPVSPVLQYLRSLRDELRRDTRGTVATYIPELARADPGAFGISVVTTDGHLYEVGDSRREFTLQSISKPFVFGLALEQHGREKVMERVGVEPSGNAFNAISVDATNRPFNPMVNAGAIVTTGLLDGVDPQARTERLLDGFAGFAGRRLAVDHAVFASERMTGDRNRALAYLMKSFGMVDGDVDETVDLYFRQCSLLVDCRDLAVMAATLANRGVNPVTGRRALDEECVESALSVMNTCGMYDFAGEWAYRVGLPAKSGVAGGVVAVLPGQIGIGVYSPPLDAKGNSVRGIEACRRLATDFSLHPLRFRPQVSAVIRRSYRGDQARSNRVRTPAASETLAAVGHRIVVYELEGDLYFASMERVFRAVAGALDDVDYVVLDFRRVGGVDDAALEMLVDLQHVLDAAAVSLVLAHAEPRSHGNPSLGVLSALGARSCASVDAALECCEDALLAAQATSCASRRRCSRCRSCSRDSATRRSPRSTSSWSSNWSTPATWSSARVMTATRCSSCCRGPSTCGYSSTAVAPIVSPRSGPASRSASWRCSTSRGARPTSSPPTTRCWPASPSMTSAASEIATRR